MPGHQSSGEGGGWNGRRAAGPVVLHSCSRLWCCCSCRACATDIPAMCSAAFAAWLRPLQYHFLSLCVRARAVGVTHSGISQGKCCTCRHMLIAHEVAPPLWPLQAEGVVAHLAGRAASRCFLTRGGSGVGSSSSSSPMVGRTVYNPAAFGARLSLQHDTLSNTALLYIISAKDCSTKWLATGKAPG